MSVFSLIVVAAIALLHIYIAWFEMFAWTTKGPEIFKQFPRDLFEPTKTLAANQGLYNGFLATGLIWSLFITDEIWQPHIALCFLIFVLVAGVCGAATASKRILYVQAAPAAVGCILVLLS
ncbi:MAG: DUF1304 domain-containing protein [Rhodobacteraceae bacterium]|nr:DUF1304 domain-containing protein [Paracoccaceae bacterium]